MFVVKGSCGATMHYDANLYLDLDHRFRSLASPSPTEVPEVSDHPCRRFPDVICPLETAAHLHNSTVRSIYESTRRYLHANRLQFDESGPAFFATQHPFPADESYWALCMQNGSFIFDLTTEADKTFLISQDRVYVDTRYFPEPGAPLQCGSYRISHVEEEQIDEDRSSLGISVQLFHIESQAGDENLSREIYYLRYPDWIDHNSVTAEVLIRLVGLVNRFQDSDIIPLLPIINCKAGIGRTGTLIVAVIMADLIRKKSVNLTNYQDTLDQVIVALRRQRGPGLVEQLAQYRTLAEFCHRLLRDSPR